ncbi:HTH-type transcriptional regulator AlsR [Arthrobacter sp. Hiyo8]|nr:HTH-type transcriptional regulator AlsR [Arthrobacter sp. Hiyo8]
MELRQLRYFMALVEHEHFGRAAASQGIKQPPLSLQIKSLEQELGVQLFTRNRNGSKLTPAGRTFAEHVRTILESIETAQRETRRTERGELGHLNVGFLASALTSILPNALRVFAGSWPDVTVEPREFRKTADAMTALSAGSVDVAFGRPPLATTVTSGSLLALRLTKDTTHVVLHRSHRLSSAPVVDPRLLSKEKFILSPLEERFPQYWHLVCRAAGFEPLVVARVQGINTVVSLVAAGIGVGVAPGPSSMSGRMDVVMRPSVTESWHPPDVDMARD